MEGLGMNPEFWKGRRVFLTGHTGFKGSWLSLWFKSLGADVTGFALAPPTNPSLFELANISAGMRSIIGDVRDFNALKKAMQDADPEIVIHMAAQPLVRYSYKNPVETYATNVMGSVHLLESVRQLKNVKAVVNVTSDKCYENREWYWGYREDEAMGGYDPYSNSKGCAELVTSAYRRSFFNPDNYDDHGVAIASARAGNVIGGGDWAEDRLIPDFIRAISSKKTITIRNPNAVRPWQHVLEPLSGYLTLAEKLFTEGSSFVGAWNFGPDPNEAKTVSWVIDNLCALWGDGASFEILADVDNLHEASYLKLDISKAHSRMKWAPKLNCLESISFVVDWHKKISKGLSASEITVEQITLFNSI
jgi:CDP-glucose 4,6-dehydratase